MQNTGKRRILVAPLDWGLGHATRCSVLIDRWLEEGHEVILASNGRSAAWLQQRYPQLDVLTDIPDYAVTYPEDGNMVAHFAKHAFRLLAVVQAEHRWLNRIVIEHAIDEVYSDNRYGLHHQEIPCTIITHQLYIRGPRWSKLITGFMLKRILKRFTSILVPDFEDDCSLSGALSHGGNHDKHVRYITPLSRFSNQMYHPTQSSFQVVALISGPEPSRSVFEEQLKRILSTLDRPALLITGKPELHQAEQMNQLSIVSHLSDEELASAIQSAELIICRSGYSTIMDLEALDVRALLVPTPGQTEQEYLAEYHAKLGRHEMISQQELSKVEFDRYLHKTP
jgi:uncharacterized protein (TIGR00661 family)